MNSEEVLTNYLSLLKSNIEVYIHGTIESSNDGIFTLLRKSLISTLDSQRNIYNILTDKGYYNVQNIKNSEIKNTLNNFNKKS